MQTLEAVDSLAEPIGAIGSWFYFAPQTQARAESLGLNAFEFYALGRGGVIADPTPERVEEVFHFFKPGVIAGLFASASRTVPIGTGVDEHLAAADTFALATFGDVPSAVLEGLIEATVALAHTLPEGRWPIYDGYRFHGLPGGTAADAFRCTIWLRELRGGVHTDAVVDSGLTPVEACYLDGNPKSFGLHGFLDDDIPAVDDGTRGRRLAAEVDTSTRMASLLAGLAPEQRAAMVAAAVAMKPALKSPVPVR